MFTKSNEALSVVSMTQYGVDMAVLTPHSNLEKARLDFETSDDSKWCMGKGKSFLYGWLKAQILKEDSYFKKNPSKAKTTNKRWSNFCDDCVNFAVLSGVLYQTPVHLLHPSCYEEALNDAYINATGGAKPTFFDDIPLLQ
jgi:hypothetical protein